MRATLKVLPYILIQLAISFLVGLNEVFEAGWSWDTFTSARFWFDYILITLATMLSFFSWADLRIYILTSTPYYKDMESNPNTDLADLGNIVAIKKHAIDNLVRDNRKADISDCLHEINMSEKTEKFIYKKTNKLFRLRASWLKNFKLTKKWYAKRIETLEKQLEDTWIAENINKIKVRYVPVTERYVVSGVAAKTSTTFRRRPESKMEKMFKDNIHKWIMSLSFMLLLSSVVFDLTQEMDLATYFNIGIKIINCIFQALMGVSYARTYVTEKVVYELDDRIEIMEYYIEWSRNKKKGVVNNG